LKRTGFDEAWNVLHTQRNVFKLGKLSKESKRPEVMFPDYNSTASARPAS
jgi:hypothetical protein